MSRPGVWSLRMLSCLQDVGYEQARSLVSENALPAAFSPWDVIHMVLVKAKKESWQDERFLLDGVHKQQAPPLRRRCPPNRRSLESGQAGDSGPAQVSIGNISGSDEWMCSVPWGSWTKRRL